MLTWGKGNQQTYHKAPTDVPNQEKMTEKVNQPLGFVHEVFFYVVEFNTVLFIIPHFMNKVFFYLLIQIR